MSRSDFQHEIIHQSLSWEQLVANIKWDADGLVPAIVQDENSKQVLMMAYMNQESLAKTLSTGKAHFFSRSRNKMWLKGETSGHVQIVKEILTDCDKDTLVVRVEQKGGACHLGYKSCFVNKLDSNGDIAEITQEKLFDPDEVYRE